MNLPEKYIENMKELLGDEFDSYLNCFNDKRLYGLRVNTLKISADEFLKISPFKLKQIPWIENGFYYSEEYKPAKHPYYFAGLYYLQEPSAMTPASILPISEGDMVLDMCAAPGGKSTELGAKLKGTGMLVSNDISASRAKALLKNIELNGIGNVMITCEEPQKLSASFPEFFDKILVDAPCSGEGMFRKDNKLIKSWESQGPDFFAPIQRHILENAAKMLKPGGYILYSTCTFSKSEDEDNINKFLSSHDDFELVQIGDYEGFTRGFGMPEAIRIFPHRMAGEGHFVCMMHRIGNLTSNYFARPVMQKMPVELTEFITHIYKPIKPENIRIINDKAYYIDPLVDNFKGIRTLRTGTLLGEIKKNRFEPSQALAMTLKVSEYDSIINLDIEDINVIKYLKGETIEIDSAQKTGNQAFKLVCVNGYTLGWGKENNNTVKNKYLPGWRWQ